MATIPGHVAAGGQIKSADINAILDTLTSQATTLSTQTTTPKVVADAYSSTITVDITTSTLHRATLTGAATIAAPLNPVDGQTLTLELSAIGGNWVATFASAFAFASSLSATPTIASGTTVVFIARYSAPYAIWRVHTESVFPAVTAATPATPTPQVLYSNALTTAGAAPSFTTTTSGSVGQSATIANSAYTINSGTGSYNQGAIRTSLVTSIPKASSVEIRFDIGFTSLIEQYHSLTFGGDGATYWPNGSGAGLPKAGYRLKFNVNANTIVIEEAYDGATVATLPWTFVAASTTGAPNLSIRWRLEGAKTQLRAWTQGTTEPTTWGLTSAAGRTDQSMGFLEFVPGTGNAGTAVVARIANLSLSTLFGTSTQSATMPTGPVLSNGKTWNPVFSEDFLVASTNPRDAAHANLYALYDDNTANGQYRDANVTYSTSYLTLQMRLLANLAGTVVPSGAAGIFFNQPFTGGRFTMRFRADTTMPTYGTAMMLFPAPSPGYSGGSWDQGEIDYPEGNFGPNDGLHLNQHILNGTPNPDGSQNDTATSYNTGGPIALWSDWHISVIEWVPGVSVMYYLDGILIWSETNTANVPTTPHNWVVQAAVPIGITPAAGETGFVQIDWVTVQQ